MVGAEDKKSRRKGKRKEERQTWSQSFFPAPKQMCTVSKHMKISRQVKQVRKAPKKRTKPTATAQGQESVTVLFCSPGSCGGSRVTGDHIIPPNQNPVYGGGREIKGCVLGMSPSMHPGLSLTFFKLPTCLSTLLNDCFLKTGKTIYSFLSSLELA